MCDELTALQKLLLRWALENREASGAAAATKKVVDGEIVKYAGAREVSRKKTQIQTDSAKDDRSYDLAEPEILSTAFGTTYRPTPAADFGLSSATGASALSRQYYIAHSFIFKPILELDFEYELAEMIPYGPSGWSGWPARTAFNLIPAGIDVARQLEGEVTRGPNGCWELDPETKARYQEALESAGISPEDIEQARKEYDPSKGWDAASIRSIVQLLDSNNPSMRMAAVQSLASLGELGEEAIPSLKVMLEDPDPTLRRWAAQVLESISGQRPSAETTRGKPSWFSIFRSFFGR